MIHLMSWRVGVFGEWYARVGELDGVVGMHWCFAGVLELVLSRHCSLVHVWIVVSSWRRSVRVPMRKFGQCLLIII